MRKFRVKAHLRRDLDENVIDLYGRVNVSTKVIVLPVEHHAEGARDGRG
ncbi:MAG TPA: hypothetical protein VKP67_19665 [Xanthobacteraceae bacterium]|nr:hypothetical protein [Xanthobacteraceae bacterium]